MRSPWNLGVFQYVNCLDCGLVYLCPQPTPEELLALYSREMPGENHPAGMFQEDRLSKFLSGPTAFQRLSRLLALRFFRLGTSWQSLPLDAGKGSRVLEVGCGSGRDAIRLHQSGWDVYGTDPNPATINLLKGVIPGHFERGSIETAGYPQRYFRTVRLRQVLEHLSSPRVTLQRLFELLEPGGTIYLSLPNIDSFGARIFRKYWIGYWPPFHVTLFSPSTLRQMLKETGFEHIEILTVTPIGLWLLSLHQLVRGRTRGRVSKIRTVVEDTTQAAGVGVTAGRTGDRHTRPGRMTRSLTQLAWLRRGLEIGTKLALVPLAGLSSYMHLGEDLVAIARRPMSGL